MNTNTRIDKKRTVLVNRAEDGAETATAAAFRIKAKREATEAINKAQYFVVLAIDKNGDTTVKSAITTNMPLCAFISLTLREFVSDMLKGAIENIRAQADEHTE